MACPVDIPIVPVRNGNAPVNGIPTALKTEPQHATERCLDVRLCPKSGWPVPCYIVLFFLWFPLCRGETDLLQARSKQYLIGPAITKLSASVLAAG